MNPPHEIDPVLGLVGKKDPELVRSDWMAANAVPIAGVRTMQITNVLTDNGVLTEIWRKDWALDDLPVDQVFQRMMAPGAVSAWHAHRLTTDRLFCAWGRVLVVLYDARPGSATRGTVQVLRIGRERPALIVVPPGVWHGVRNQGDEPALLINAVDKAYCYGDPDHYRLPADTPDIPYRIV